jgi:predicted metal-binding membrane protein
MSHAISARMSQRTFFGVSGLLFAASATATVLWCASMSAMHGMRMPGGWTMSMAWMRMPTQTWPEVAASFLGMWMVMMAAMMLPSLLPMLLRYRAAIGPINQAHISRLTLLVGAAYFFVWSVFGIVAFAAGVTLAAIVMQQPVLAHLVPIAIGGLVVFAGALQFTAWKQRQLACCRHAHCAQSMRADARTAWRHGLQLGLRCCYCCSGLTAILLVIGVMDLRAMAAVTVAITLERLAPAGERVAHAIGFVVVAAGVLLVAQALGAW